MGPNLGITGKGRGPLWVLEVTLKANVGDLGGVASVVVNGAYFDRLVIGSLERLPPT